MERRKRFEDVPLNIYIPEPVTILLVVLSFLAGFLYRKYNDKEEIADAFEEGFEKGAYSVARAIELKTGEVIELDFGRGEMD